VRCAPCARVAPPDARAACAQRFFDCLNGDNSAQSIWWKGLKAKMNRIIIHRKMESGEAQTDGAATCIYLDCVREMSAAYARANTREAAERKLGIKTLWRCSGRPGEPGCIS
jgi:hypothetical protein